MQPYPQTQYNQMIHPPFIDFELLKRKHIQEDLNKCLQNTYNSQYVTEQAYWDQY